MGDQVSQEMTPAERAAWTMKLKDVGVPEKLPVKGPSDLVQSGEAFINSEQPPILNRVDVPDLPEVVPVITWGELLRASVNVYLRNYVVDNLTGQTVTVSTRYWFGFASGVVSVVLLGFTLWKLGLF
jgi:hypothetical protein